MLAAGLSRGADKRDTIVFINVLVPSRVNISAREKILNAIMQLIVQCVYNIFKPDMNKLV